MGNGLLVVVSWQSLVCPRTKHNVSSFLHSPSSLVSCTYCWIVSFFEALASRYVSYREKLYCWNHTHSIRNYKLLQLTTNPLLYFIIQLHTSNLLTYRCILHDKNSMKLRVDNISSVSFFFFFFAEKERDRLGNRKPPSVGSKAWFSYVADKPVPGTTLRHMWTFIAHT